MQTKTIAFLLALTMLALPALALADCSITAHISAEESDSDLGAYQYTMDFSWDMDSQYGLSHFNLQVDGPGGSCSCSDFSDNIAFEAIAGSSTGEGNCMVDYTAELECHGDPSIPGLEGIIFKFEPIEGDCEPGNMGSGTLTFYSDLAPVPVDEEVFALSDKGAHVYCTGTITGVFPALVCDPVATENSDWDNVKSYYR